MGKLSRQIIFLHMFLRNDHICITGKGLPQRNPSHLVFTGGNTPGQERNTKSVRNHAKKRIRLVEYRTQGKDHPILPQAVETKYLKCMILQVME